jgi:hypothetical protein
MLRGKVSNAGAPLSYSAWNLPPQSPFSEFISNPPVQDGSLVHRVRPSLDDIEVFIAPFQNHLEAERHTHFYMPTSTDEAEVNDVLSMLAGESSEFTCTESMAIAIGQDLGEDKGVQSPESVRRKRSRWTSNPVAPNEEKKRKKRLRRLSCLEQDVGPSTSLLGGGPMSTTLEDDIGGCDDARVGSCVIDEDEEEEEEEITLIRKNSHNSRSSDILMQALSGLVSLQGLTMSAIDHALEEIIPKNLLSEPPEVESSIVHSEVLDDVPLLGDLVGQEVTQTVSHASLVIDVAGQSHPAPLGTSKGASALEGAAKVDPSPEGGAEGDRAPEGGAEDNPAPNDVGPSSSLASSMDVHIGSPLVCSEEPVVTNLSIALVGPATLEASDPDARNLPPADRA